MHYVFALAFVSFLGGAAADSTINPSMADPDQRSGWYSKPNLRSTTDILWSCLSTIFICVWVCLHLNIPAAKEGEIRQFLRKLWIMALGVLAPEYLTWMAIVQWFEARAITKQVQGNNHFPKPWTITHSFYLIMGGFVISDNGDPARYFPVRGGEIISLSNARIIEIPDISREAIWDRSKADSLGKAIVCIQVSWLWLQCVARAAQGLPLTTLEITTVAYVLSTIITYCFWWYKPLDVVVPTLIPIVEGRSAHEIKLTRYHRIRNQDYSRSNNTALLCGLGAMVAYCGTHFLAWSHSFPTPVEQLLWRICTAATIFSALLYSIAHEFFDDYIRENLRMTIGLAGVICYILNRLYMIAESFASLRSAPAGIYVDVDWMAFLQGRKSQG